MPTTASYATSLRPSGYTRALRNQTSGGCGQVGAPEASEIEQETKAKTDKGEHPNYDYDDAAAADDDDGAPK